MRLFLQAVNHSCPSALWEAAEVGAGAILTQLQRTDLLKLLQ